MPPLSAVGISGLQPGRIQRVVFTGDLEWAD